MRMEAYAKVSKAKVVTESLVPTSKVEANFFDTIKDVLFYCTLKSRSM